MGNPYRILGVKSSMSKEEIKSVYRQLSRKYHPDNLETGNAEKFQAINKAWKEIEKNHAGFFSEGKVNYIHKTLFTIKRV